MFFLTVLCLETCFQDGSKEDLSFLLVVSTKPSTGSNDDNISWTYSQQFSGKAENLYCTRGLVSRGFALAKNCIVR